MAAPPRAAAPTRPSPWRSLSHRPFAAWSRANAISSVSTWMQLVAQTLLVMTLTGSVALAGVATSLQLAPALLLGPYAGALADRVTRQRIVVVSQTAMAAVALVVAVLVATGGLDLPALLVLCTVSGTVAALSTPAVALFGTELVPAEDVPSAVAVGSLVSNAGRLAGAALAAAVLALASPAAAFAGNGLAFLLVRRAARRLPCAAPTVTATPAEAPTSAGIRHALRDRDLAWLFTIACTAGVVSGQYQLTAGALVLGPLHGGAGALGAVGVALAVGAVSGALWAGRWERPTMPAIAGCVATGAVLQVCAGLTPGLVPLLVILVGAGFVQSAAAVAAMTMVQTRPPGALRGRVLAGWGSATGFCGLLCPLVLGATLSLAGPRAGLVLSGLVALALALGARSLSVRLQTPGRTRGVGDLNGVGKTFGQTFRTRSSG